MSAWKRYNEVSSTQLALDPETINGSPQGESKKRLHQPMHVHISQDRHPNKPKRELHWKVQVDSKSETP